MGGTHKIFADIDVDGEVKGTSLDLNGNAQIDGTITVGQDDTGYDVKFFLAASGRYIMIDEDDNSLLFTDNANAKWGNGGDLQISHDGTDSRIDNMVGHLKIRNYSDDSDIIFETDNGSGSTTEYLKIDGGITSILAYKDILMANDGVNGKIKFGASQDLSIFHDGSNSYLENKVGNLIIRQEANDADLILKCDDGSGGDTAYITLDGSQEAVVFGKAPHIPEYIIHDGDGNTYFGFAAADTFRVGTGGTTRLDISTGIELTGNTTLTGALSITGDGSNAATLTESGSGDFDISTVDDLRLTSGGNDVVLRGASSAEFGRLTNSSQDFVIQNITSDKDIIFKGNDGGATITALTLDISDAGTAIFNHDIKLSDSGKVRLGSSNDLEMYHNGTASYVTNDTGHLNIENNHNDGDIVLKTDDGSGGLTAYLTLDGDNVRTLVHKNLNVEDNVQLQIGNSQDLKLYHNGSHSYIAQAGVGNLYIQNEVDDGDIIFISDDGSGGVEEYFRLDGSANGANPLTIFPDNSNLAFGSAPDTYLMHNGTDFLLDNYNTGDIHIRNNVDDKDIKFSCDDGSGGVTPYFFLDGSAGYTMVKKRFNFSDSVKATFGTSEDLQIQHNGTDSQITNNTGHLQFTNVADDKDISFATDNGSGGDTEYFRLDGSAKTLVTSVPLHIPEYIVHDGDTNSYFGFSAADTFNLHVGGAEVLRVNGGSTTDEAAVSILCGGGTNVENIALLLKGDTNGEALKLKIQNPNNGGTLTGAGIISYEPDADTFNIGQSTTHANMAISIDNSENVTLAAALTVTGNIQCNGNIAGDDGTAITHISSIGADTYAADADSTTRIQMSASSMDFLVADEDVFDINSTTLNVSGTLVAKKHKLAKTSNTDGNADGDIVYFGGTTSMDTGKIYYFNSSGGWTLADADAESTAKGMLGVALGTASDTNGVLIRGMVTLDTDPGTIGDTLFLSTTAGVATSTAPSGNGDIVRVIGYCLDSTNGQIYFNPDGTFVEVTA